MVSIRQTSIKQKKQRHLFKISEKTRRSYKFLKKNASRLGYMPVRNLTPIRIKNSCLITGHQHSVYSKRLRLSRHQIKKYFSYITSLRNSSW